MGLHRDILATLSYFDLFHYPLTAPEIYSFLPSDRTSSEVSESLRELCSEGWVFRFDEFFSLHEDLGLIHRRRKGNAEARRMLQTASRVARLLSSFPFVKGVAVSGSLSKNFADAGSDIDFFIITESNRLWIARTLLHLLKKCSFLVGRQDWFCMNYFIDESALEIREKNLYTAIEVATLLPLRGIGSFDAFFGANRWVRDFLPNHALRVAHVQEARRPLLTWLVELLLRNRAGGLLDRGLMQLSLYRWKRKTERGQRNKRGVLMAMDGGRHHAKPCPAAFQEKLLGRYEKKITNLFRRFGTRAKTL